MENVLMASFVAVESAHSFSAFLPSVFTIKSLAVRQGEEKYLREGYIPAIIFSLGLGFIVSKLIKSWLPLWFAIGTIAFMICCYEFAIWSVR